jgi:GYF domain 2
MDILIHRNGQQYGPYSQQDIFKYLNDGSLTQDDLAWYEGAPQWVPLRNIPALKSVNGAHSLPPAPQSVISPFYSTLLSKPFDINGYVILAAVTICIFGVLYLLKTAYGRDTSSVEKTLLGHWTLESSMFIDSFPDSEKTHLYFDKASLIVVKTGKPPVKETYKVVMANNNNNWITLKLSENPGIDKKYIFSSDRKFMTNPISFLGHEMRAIYKYVDSKTAP